MEDRMRFYMNSRIRLTVSYTAMLWVLMVTICFLPLHALELHRVTPDEAAAGMDKWRVLDARSTTIWQKGHLPEAYAFSWEDYTRTDHDGVKYRIFPPEELASALGKLGISHADSILIYGDADSTWGGEGWLVWMLAWLGHRGPVYFLEGGLSAWQSSGRPLTNVSPVKHLPVAYQVRMNPDLFWTADQVAKRKDEINLIDTRGYWAEWLPGHLPNAIHISWEKFFQGKNRTALSPKALKVLLEKKGVDLTKPVVYYCSGGIRSGYAWMVHELSGLPSAVNFEGGTEEWTRNRALVR